MHVVVSSPQGYEPAAEMVALAQQIGKQTGGSARLEPEVGAAVDGADVVITDTWVSMGKEGESQARLRALAPYALTRDLMGKAGAGAIAMHCLPAYRGKEIAAEMNDGPDSVQGDEAANSRTAKQADQTCRQEKATE